MAQDFTKLGKLTNSPDSTWDIIVIGSGSNGLVAACYLAAAGKKVLVLERQPWAGGGVASLEMADPGYQSERHATIHQMILANPLITSDELSLQARYGLSYLPLDPLYAIVTPTAVLPIHRSRSRTQAAIAALSPADAAAYAPFMATSVAITALLLPTMFAPPTDTAPLIAASPLAAPIAAATQQSAHDLITAHFAHETVRVALCRFVSEIALAHPRKPGTALLAHLALGLAESHGLALPRGGGAAFTAALVACLRAHGGQIWLSAEATKVVVADGRAVGVRTRAGEVAAREAVVGQIHPHELGRYVDGVDAGVVAAAAATRHSDYAIFSLHAALEGPLRFRAGGVADAAVMNTVSPASVEALLRSYDELDAGRLPADVLVGASCTTVVDGSRAPEGRSLLHGSVMVPYELADGGAAAWDRIKDDYARQVFEYVARFAPSLTPQSVLSYHVVTPTDSERDSPSFRRGDIMGIAMDPAQSGLNRPTRALSGYRVPGVKGLYLAGPFMHPGGGVWGGGRPVAMTICADLGIDFGGLFEKKGDAGKANL